MYSALPARKNTGSWKNLGMGVSLLPATGMTVLRVRFEIQERAEPVECWVSVESPIDQWIPREGDVPLRHVA